MDDLGESYGAHFRYWRVVRGWDLIRVGPVYVGLLLNYLSTLLDSRGEFLKTHAVLSYSYFAVDYPVRDLYV